MELLELIFLNFCTLELRVGVLKMEVDTFDLFHTVL